MIMSAAMGFFPRDSSSRGKRAISVWAIEVLLYSVVSISTDILDNLQ